jgi:predicted GH43/DUF377 family glycosyl hydrolase
MPLAAYTLAPDGDTIRLCYGAADSSIGFATGSVRALLQSVLKE